VTRALLLDSLRHFVSELHVDGFRFDLASILTRGEDGQPLASPSLVEGIARDPVLARVKLIAEAWDAAGLYQVGGFPHFTRFAEWNGRFRDDVRRFLRGDPGSLPGLATRLAGSSDLYQGMGRPPWHSLNFVTCHDGFTLHDLVSYERKHNADNGHEGTDGTDDNLSANWGVEGETAAPAVRQVRARQQRNALVLLFLAQGVPMLLGGDELSRTQRGNNNAYCQDSEISWVDWAAGDQDLRLFTSRLARFRRAHPSLRRRSYTEPGDAPWAIWHGLKPGRPEWKHSRVLGLQLLGLGRDDEILLLVNGEDRRHRFELPALPGDRHWRRFVDTGLPAPGDSVEPGQEPALGTRHTVDLAPHSTVVLVGR
jgi:glycogen operon protein